MSENLPVEISLKEKALAELSPIEAGIKDLQAKYGSKAYDCTTSAGMDEAKADRLAVREVRYKIPHIEKSVTRQLNELKKDIQSKAELLTQELLAIERVSDEPIKAEEERRAAIKAEKERIEAERVAGIRTRIDNIKLLPAKAVGASAEDIRTFIDRVSQSPIGADFEEFTTEAQEAKDQAIVALGQMLDAQIAAEEEAKIREELRLEQEKAAALDRERLEAEKQAFEAEKRRFEEQQAELQKLRDAEEAKFRAEKEAYEKEQTEIKRIADAKTAAEAEEQKRIADEAAAKQREEERQAAILAEQKRAAAEKEKRSAEKARKLAEAKCQDAETAFRKILNICNDHDLSGEEVRCQVSIIAEANL